MLGAAETEEEVTWRISGETASDVQVWVVCLELGRIRHSPIGRVAQSDPLLAKQPGFRWRAEICKDM